MLAVVEATSRQLFRRDDEGMLSRQLSTRLLPIAPMPIGYCGRNRRFVLRMYFHIEQSLEPHRISHGRATLMPVSFRSVGTISTWSPISFGRLWDAGGTRPYQFFTTRNPGAGKDFTDLAAAVQRRLRVVSGLQALQRCSGLLNRKARGSTVATHHDLQRCQLKPHRFRRI